MAVSAALPPPAAPALSLCPLRRASLVGGVRGAGHGPLPPPRPAPLSRRPAAATAAAGQDSEGRVRGLLLLLRGRRPRGRP